MNNRTLIALAIFTTLTQSPAQDQFLVAEPEATVANLVTNPHVDRDGTLHLLAGPLVEVVGQIERCVSGLNKANESEDAMPNVIFEGQTSGRNIVVPGNLRLRKVTPVQAVALAAAAAGCTLEAVPDPDGEVIGYRIVPSSKKETDSDIAGIGVTIVSEGGEAVVKDILPDSPAGRSRQITVGDRIVSVAERGNPPVSLSGRKISEVVELLRGPAGSVAQLKLVSKRGEGKVEVEVPVVREKLNYAAEKTRIPVNVINPTVAEIQTAPAAEARYTDAQNQFAKQSQESKAVVCVYSMGSILSGTEAEVAEKRDAFQELVAEALERSETGKEHPVLSFHDKSKALIVKATRAEHVIIQQVINALKENELETGKGTIRR